LRVRIQTAWAFYQDWGQTRDHDSDERSRGS
jgi:hypothetical protein